MRLWFGRYRGWPIEDVPPGYLVWLADTTDSATLRQAAELALGIVRLRQEYATLLATVAHAHAERATRAPAGLAERWLRIMARKHHPDAGGTDEAMRVVNEGFDELRRLLGPNAAVEVRQ